MTMKCGRLENVEHFEGNVENFYTAKLVRSKKLSTLHMIATSAISLFMNGIILQRTNLRLLPKNYQIILTILKKWHKYVVAFIPDATM